ncbi:MAG: hypothetical protein R3B90_21420 [Planctomycetaceae bacterium]
MAQRNGSALQCVGRQAVLAAARELAEEYGESLTLTAFRRETGWSQHLIFDLFGNWKNLRVAVGLTPMAPRYRTRITKAEVVRKLRECVAAKGENLTEWEFCRESGVTSRLIQSRFGTWGALRESIGLEPRARMTRRKYSDLDCLKDLFAVYLRTGVRPRYHRHKQLGGKINPLTIRERYGTWENVRLAFEVYRRKMAKQGVLPQVPEDLFGRGLR